MTSYLDALAMIIEFSEGILGDYLQLNYLAIQ